MNTKNTPTHTPLHIGLVGYGKMGKEIETQLLERKHIVAFKVDPFAKNVDAKNLKELKTQISHTQIVIEFSSADAVQDNAQFYMANNISAIIGTTGWDDKLQEIKKIIVKNSNICYLYGGNFSIGAHLFMQISKFAARLLNKIEEYDISINETHHIQKKDRPSGTAIMTANLILEELTRKKNITIDLPKDNPINPEQLAIISQRVGHELGLHNIIADSAFDTITISHHARSRSGFALGSVLAAEWVHTKLQHNAKEIVGVRTVYDFINDWLK